MSDSQRLDLKLYEQNLLQQIGNSKLSFNQIDTPGWTSLVRNSQVFTDNERLKSRNSIETIDNKSVRLQTNNNTNRIYIKSKVNRGSCLLEIDQCQFDNRERSSLTEKQNNLFQSCKPKIGLREKIQMKLLGLAAQSQYTSSIGNSQFSTREQNRSKNSNLKAKISEHDRSKVQKMLMRSNSCSQFSKKSQKGQKKQNSRFKQINVYQHLYQSSKKLEQKKQVKKLLDQKFHSVYVAPFQPVINLNSSRMAQKINSGQIRPIKVKEQNNLASIPEFKVKEPKQIDQNTLKLFQYLSQEKIITEDSLNKALESLPLCCVSLLGNFIKLVYSGNQYTFEAFQGILNNKKVIVNKQKLLKFFVKWHKE